MNNSTATKVVIKEIKNDADEQIILLVKVNPESNQSNFKMAYDLSYEYLQNCYCNSNELAKNIFWISGSKITSDKSIIIFKFTEKTNGG